MFFFLSPPAFAVLLSASSVSAEVAAPAPSPAANAAAIAALQKLVQTNAKKIADIELEKTKKPKYNVRAGSLDPNAPKATRGRFAKKKPVTAAPPAATAPAAAPKPAQGNLEAGSQCNSSTDCKSKI